MTRRPPRQQRPVPPIEYTGKIVAWDKDHTKIIATGTTFAEVKIAAEAAGEIDPVFEKVPRADARFAGAL